MKRSKLLFFSGNRAEFGYLLPFFIELHKYHSIDFIVSGTHLLAPWNSIDEIKESIQKYDLSVNIIKMQTIDSVNAHIDSFADIHASTVKILTKVKYDYAFVLGDRPESFAFASAVFLHQTVLIHYAGGDVTDNAYLDSNIRHVITKMAHLHLTLSEDSKKIVEQLGEEPWRVQNVGISTYDYDRLALLPTKESIKSLLHSFDFSRFTCIVTYHCTQYKNADENYEDFLKLLKKLKNFDLNVLITYPNNDTGSQKIIYYLEHEKLPKKIVVIKNLGTLNMLCLYKNFQTIVIGNSSSGLLETALYKTPCLNVGDRQGNRKRADNVFNVSLEDTSIEEKLYYVMQNYQSIQKNCEQRKGIFGFGKSTAVLRKLIEDASLKKEKLLFKKFSFLV